MHIKLNKSLLISLISIIFTGILIHLVLILNDYGYFLNKKPQKNNEYNLDINTLIISKAKSLADGHVHSTYDNSHLNNIHDTQNGIYKVDCSGFVKLVLQQQKLLNPIQEIISFIPKNFIPSIINDVPSPLHYVIFLKSKKPKKHWYIINNPLDLMPGDFIVYIPKKYKIKFGKHKKLNSEYGQHIMIVADQPKQTNNNKTSNNIKLLWIYILDSTKIPHGTTDHRQINKSTGIGKGIIGLIINHRNKPMQLIWRDYSANNCWIPTKKDLLEREIILARIISD